MPKQIDELNNVLRDNGYRLTSARRVILEALVGHSAPVSADGLVELVRSGTDPGIGRMTIYRTLDLLSQLRLIRAVHQGSGAAHYVLMDDGHHHLTCTGCGATIEVNEWDVKPLEQLVGERFKFHVTGHLLEFYGRCETCQ